MNRLFLALKVHLYDYNKIKSDFSDIIEGRWVVSENIHITLAYFGDIYTTQELVERLPDSLEHIEQLKLDSLGYFEKNKILYAGLKNSKLDSISSSLIKQFSLSNTKEFIPHATLMRVKNIKDENRFKEVLESYKNKPIGTVKNSFELINSYIEHPGGAKYETIKIYSITL